MKNVLVFNNPNYWNRSKGIDMIDNILVDLDKEGTELEALTVKNQGKWTNDLEYMKNYFVYDAKELTKVSVTGKGTFVTASLSYPGKDVIKNMKEGYIIVATHEVSSILHYLQERYGYLQDFKDINEKLEKKEEKLAELKAQKDELEKEDYADKKAKIEKKIESIKRTRQTIRDQLGMGHFNATYLMSESLYLFKNVKPIYMNEAADVIILEIERKSSFTYKDFDLWTELAHEFKHEDADEAEEKLREYLVPFTEFDYKVKVPIMSGFMLPVLDEEVLEVDIAGTVDMAGSVPAAPVKPSIAAAMLASGAGGKLDKGIELDGESCLIKTAITPIQMVETIEMNGQEEVVRTFTWEPQLGLFNKLRKEFQILS